MVPRAVLMKSGLVSINTARQNISKTAVLVNTARQVNTAHSKTTVNAARPMSYLSKTTHSTVKRPIHKNTTFKNSNINQRVNTVRGKKFNTARPKAVVNAVKGNNFNAVKASACWADPMDAQGHDRGTCPIHKNIDYEEIDGGYVAFGGNPKGGKITGKCTIKTGNLDFENVYFVRELKFNLFSVSQMCDKKNSVLFNDTEYIVLSPNFKLIDESQVLLRVPRKNNMYSVDLKNIVPKGGLTFLFAKATSDESKLWHRRLGHLNFKTMNKLVKGNLVRGLPSKVFENDHTVLPCQKGSNTELLTPTLSFMRPFVSHVTILNTIDHLSKFDGKADEDFFVGYSLNSKAFRVFNSRTRIVEENLLIRFSGSTPNVVGSGPDWLFDIDALTRTMNYEPIVAGTQSNGFAGTKASDNAGEIAIRELKKKLEIVQKEKDGIQLNVDKFEHASKSLNKLIECQIVDNCKKGLGDENYNVVPPPYTGNFMPIIPDLSFTGLDEFVNEPVVENCDEEEDVSQPKIEKKTVRPSIVKKEFVKLKQQEKSDRKTVKQVEQHRQNTHSPRGNQRNWNNMMSQKLGSNFEMFNKACYVCGSFDDLQVDCNYHQKQFQNQRMVRPVWNNAQRVKQQNFAKKTHPCAKKNLVPRAVVMKSGLVSVNTARQVNATHSKTTMNATRPMSYLSKQQI
ncbi:ribonuclease H-like domain-containing protein [Tanacetum coccineum]